MKIRNGFVSNSSSSSFTISRHVINNVQLYLIQNYEEIAKAVGMDYVDSPWVIDLGDEEISFYTDMDNFDMEEYLTKIGIAKYNINYQYED